MALAERLRDAGLDVWIDTQGIDAADLWPKEIVQAIWGCKAFLVLISESSLLSKSVLRELSLATEKKKPVLPLKLTSVELNEDFAYHLAGVQRVAANDFEAIERALNKLGVVGVDGSRNTPGKRPALPIYRPNAGRPSLLVLPFDDLSPAGENNLWFADGLAGELIDALWHIASLRVLDRKTSLALRGVKLRVSEIGREFDVRFCIDGSVRSFGDQLKISVSLLDLETGTTLWQESYRGAFKDIFDIQESVARKVVEALKLHVSADERSHIQDRGTSDADAYNLIVRAHEYYERHTRNGFELAAQLATQAIGLDRSYAEAYAFKAEALTSLYRTYTLAPGLLNEALRLVQEALRLKPDLWDAYRPLSMLYYLQGNPDEAEKAATTYVANAPDNASSHAALGYFYDVTGQYERAVSAYEQAVKRSPEYLPNVWNLILACNYAGNQELRSYWAGLAIPLFERHLTFFPDDEFARTCHASLLHFVGRDQEASAAISRLGDLHDGTSLYSLACLECELGNYESGLITFQKSINAEYRNVPLLTRFMTDDVSGIGKLAGTTPWQNILSLVEKIAKQKTTTGLD